MVVLIVLLSVIVIAALVVMSRVTKRLPRRQPYKPTGETWKKIDR